MLNLVHQGDCLELLRCVESNSVDMVLTSPPYDNLRTYKGYSFDFEGVARELYRVVKPGGVVVWIVNDATVNGSETGTSFRQALFFKEIGFNLHDTMIWEKQTFTATGALATRYAQVFEYMFVLSKGRIAKFNPIKDRQTKGPRKKHGTIRQADGSLRRMSSVGKVYSSERAQRFNVWKINTETSNRIRCHPAQFPESLARDHVNSWSNSGDVVLDPFGGCGTTAVACQQLGRNFIHFEISAEYCEIARLRLKQSAEAA